MDTFLPNPELKLREQLGEVMRFKHYSIHTEEITLPMPVYNELSLIILNLKKIELADYLLSLAVAPLITYFWR